MDCNKSMFVKAISGFVRLPVVAALLALPCIALAQHDTVSSKGLSLATAEQFAPYAYQNDVGVWTGIDIDILTAVFKQAGIEFVVAGFPRSRITLMLEKDMLDGLVSTASYNENDQLEMLWQSDRLYYSEISAFSLNVFPSAKATEKGFLMNTHYRLGVLNEFSYLVEGTELAERDNLIKVHRDQQLVDLLSIGRVDLIISEDISFIYTARRSGKFASIKPLLEITSRPVSIALSRKVIEAHPDFADRINKSIIQLRKSGFIDAVIVKYLTLN